MSTIWAMTHNALVGLSIPLAASNYLAATPGGNLPDQYITYKVIDLTPEAHADDEETLRSELVQVSVRSRAGLQSLPDVIGAMTAAGFKFAGGRELDFDFESSHFGIAFDFENLRDLGT